MIKLGACICECGYVYYCVCSTLYSQPLHSERLPDHQISLLADNYFQIGLIPLHLQIVQKTFFP